MLPSRVVQFKTTLNFVSSSIVMGMFRKIVEIAKIIDKVYAFENETSFSNFCFMASGTQQNGMRQLPS